MTHNELMKYYKKVIRKEKRDKFFKKLFRVKKENSYSFKLGWKELKKQEEMRKIFDIDACQNNLRNWIET